MEKLILDSDVLLNWLLQEVETHSSLKLWVAPSVILELGEQRMIANQVSLISMMEVRYVLRRKKTWPMESIEADLRQLKRILNFIAPVQGDIEQAERLQSEDWLDPFDSIILSQAINSRSRLITRDSALIEIAKKYIAVSTPEEYVNQCMN